MTDRTFQPTGEEIRHGLRRTLRAAKYAIGEHAVGLPLLLRLTPEGTDRGVVAGTDLVVEGFPRSGTTFAVFALRHANPDIRIASHVHHLAQIRRAIALDRPTIVIVREPLECLASYLLAGPHGRPRGVLREYIDYHSAVAALGDTIAIVPFESVINSMAAVTDAINRRFNLALVPFSDADEAVENVFAAISTKHSAYPGVSPFAHGVARPDDRRAEEKSKKLTQLSSPEFAERLSDARTVYEALISSALL